MEDEVVVDSSTATVEEKQETTPAGKPDRKGWIPREQFDQLAQTVADLTAVIKSQSKPEEKKVEPPKTLTRADLRMAVEKQQITQEEADNLWDNQLLERAREIARQEANQTLSVKQTSQRIDEDLRQYRVAVPNAWKEGTEERVKVAEEFRNLVERGLPETKETELVALRVVFGPVEKAKSRPSVEHDEQAAGAGSPERKSEDTIKSLDARRKAYYEDQIKVGRYKDWGEVRKELEDYAKRKRA
jgi:hypothetical protein